MITKIAEKERARFIPPFYFVGYLSLRGPLLFLCCHALVGLIPFPHVLFCLFEEPYRVFRKGPGQTRITDLTLQKCLKAFFWFFGIEDKRIFPLFLERGAGSKNCRWNGSQPPPGPPWTNSTGTPLAFPHSST